MKNELFIIAPSTIAAMNLEDVQQTAHDMRELDIFNLPYKKVDILIYVDVATEINFPAGTNAEVVENYICGRSHALKVSHTDDTCLTMQFIGVSVGKEPNGTPYFTCDYMLLEGCEPKYRDFHDLRQEFTDNHVDSIMTMCELLIVSLATRNAHKSTVVNKLAKLGIGKKRKGTQSYPRVTTITISKELEDDSEHSTEGKPKAPHLRRGHIRNQHYGPKGSFRKRVWIQPCFVNADKDFVSSRQAYNLSL